MCTESVDVAMMSSLIRDTAIDTAAAVRSIAVVATVDYVHDDVDNEPDYNHANTVVAMVDYVNDDNHANAVVAMVDYV